MFPFQGMPTWAQYIGNVLPMTHFISITRGVVLKDMSLALVGQQLIPITAFLVAVLFVAMRCYRSTLD